LRGEPDGGENFRDFKLGAGAGAVEEEGAALGAVGGAGAERRAVRQGGGDGPAAGRCLALAGEVGKARAAQPAAGGEQGDRLQQIGFARPVRAGENIEAGFRLEPEGAVGAKIREGQAGDNGGYTRIGIST
jgi:hypothetical protein